MKYTEEQKQKFRDLVAEGKPIKEAAAEAGISLAIGKVIRVQDNRKSRENSSSPPPEEPKEPPVEEQEENLSEGSVPPPDSGGGGASDGSGARGADGARTALKDDEEEKGEEGKDGSGEGEQKEGEEKSEGESEEEKAPIDPAETLLDLSEMLCSGMVWLFARRKKVKLTWEQRNELEWSKEERAFLYRSAKSAARALPDFVTALGPYVGLAFYAYFLFKLTETRCHQVDAWSPKGKKEGDDAGEEEEVIKDADWEEKGSSQLNDKGEGW